MLLQAGGHLKGQLREVQEWGSQLQVWGVVPRVLHLEVRQAEVERESGEEPEEVVLQALPVREELQGKESNAD